VISSPRRCRLVEGKLGFNEELSLVTNMLYDARNRKYVKKEVLVIMNLVSNSRPSESKMVGRVVVDLGGAANGLQYQ
jgi:N-terminal C2 in EEIG1 and EHBP1 proteins